MGKVLAITSISLLLMFASGCGNPGIVEISPDTYMLIRRDYGGIFGNPDQMNADVVREAKEFAEKQGKVIIPLDTNTTPGGYGRLASISYQFRVVDKDDPEVRRTHLIKGPDISIKRDDSVKVDIDVKANNGDNRNSDLYTELTKLDDLLKRGILTKEEFEVQKKLLLEKCK